MEYVRIAILSAYDKVCAHMDNEAEEALHYYNDELTEYLKGTAATYTFSANAQHPDSQYLVEGNKIAFRKNEKDYYMNIMHVERDEYEVAVEAYSLSFELLNEQRGAYKAASAMSFEEYLAVFDPEHVITLGTNEVSEKRITNEWTGEDTILARLFSLATVFSAELEFLPELNDNYSLRRIVMNVYQEHSDTTQGVGQRRTDLTLRYNQEISGITKISDITELYTAITPTGRDGLTLASLDKTEYDSEGKVEYRKPAGSTHLYAVQARDRFPSNLMANENERYIGVNWEYDTDNVNTLYGQALAQLKANCVPKVTYEVEGYFDTSIGDTVTIADESFNPELYLEARVTEQRRSFTDPSQNKTTFNNFKELQNQIDESLLARVEELIAQNKTYTAMISTDNGIVFRNGIGETTMTAHVRDAGGVELADNYEIHWLKDGAEVYIGNPYTITANDVEGKAVYRFEAVDTSGTVKAFYEVTVSDVSDGQDGEDGEPGPEGPAGPIGPPGADGKSLYTWIKYADSPTTGMSDTPEGKQYMGIAYNQESPVESTDYGDYEWSLITGEGVPGPAGEDGKTYYTWIRYADDASGNGMSDNPEGKDYIGIAYNQESQAESSNPKDYIWSLFRGPQGIPGPQGEQGVPGPAGADGKTTYFHIKYSPNANGDPMSEVPDVYIGTYVDFNQIDSTDPEDYTWMRFQGAQGADGAQGIPGTNGEDGKTSYLHIAYANSADGKTGFSVSDSAGKQYIGQYVDFTQTDSTDPAAYSWTKIKGEDGKDGVSLYTWIKYADTPTTGMSDSPDGKQYMGIAYNKTSPTESNDYNDYAWSLITGEGVPGAPGEDGKTLYTWVKYADDAQGNGISDSPTGKNYIGLAYNKETATESNSPSDYTWALFRGPQGVQGPQGEKGDPGEQGVPGPAGADGKTSYFHIKYSSVANPTSSSQMTETPSAYIGTYVDFSEADSNDPADYTWSKFQGDPGAQGIPGQNGENGMTSYLHIAYANSADGHTDFSVSDSTGRAYMGVYVDFNQDDSSDPEDYTWSRTKGDPGPAGEGGKPTGITVSSTEPEDPYTGMLWKHTGTVAGLIKNATYRWDGDSWELYLFTADNIDVQTLSAIVANLGNVTAGSLKVEWSQESDGVNSASGTTYFSDEDGDGQMRIEYTVKNASGAITRQGTARYGYDGLYLTSTDSDGKESHINLKYSGLDLSDGEHAEILGIGHISRLKTALCAGGSTFAGDMNNAESMDPGFYFCEFVNITNAPYTSGYGVLEKANLDFSGNAYVEKIYRYVNGYIAEIAMRIYANSQWYDWTYIPVNGAPWNTLTLINNVAASEGRTPMYKNTGKRVELTGQIAKASGSFTTTAFVAATLPVGSRPAENKVFMAADNTFKGARVAVLSSGLIQVQSANSSSYVSLDGIAFDID